ncbi:Wzz/FepE/Etk N-terminal domain-containing protein [Kineococcus rubinsiae]|uniref:Wzz/FepE/Etk N-terminal domain-containing protein n=1 Tax=Kineococcus rubinsiae TaxID=2609562 RepID=UPI0014302C91|nr:Wzz/FepE/Etk N-terminal domain-containing protein [Kineococcus rubinsiae]
MGSILLKALRRRAWIVVVCLLAGLGAGIAAATLLPRTYASTTQIYVSLAPTATAADVFGSSSFLEQRAQTYAELVQGESFERTVQTTTGAAEKPELTAQIKDNTVLLAVTAQADSATLAQAEANAAAQLIIQRAAALEGRTDATATLLLQIVEPANLPETAGFPTPPVLVVMGLVVGLVVGLAAAVLVARMNSTLRRPGDLLDLSSFEHTTWLQRRGHTQDDAQALVALYRQLLSGDRGDGQTLLLTACTPADADTAADLASELAGTLVQAGLSVAVVDLGRVPETPRPGLSDLIDGAPVAVAAVPRRDTVRMLHAGTHPLRVSTATGAEIERALTALLREVDAVVVLAPPVVAGRPFPAVAYARAADAVLLVGTQRRSSTREVEAAYAAASGWQAQGAEVVLVGQRARTKGTHATTQREAVATAP